MADRRERVGDVVEAIRAANEGSQALLHVAMPGIVQSFDPAAMTVTVQPAIRAKVLSADGGVSSLTMPLLVDVPVVFPGGGGYVATFPIAAGDECLVVFGERCIDSWWQSGGVQEPFEHRMHDLSDAFCIVGPRSLPNVISGISATAAQLRSEDGTVFAEVDQGGLARVRAGATEAKVNSDGNASITAATKITLSAPLVEATMILKGNSVEDSVRSIAADRVIYNGHTHLLTGGPSTAAPTQQM